MKLTFLGTGEAIGTDRGNSTFLIDDGVGSIMFDCGWRAPFSLMNYLNTNGKNILDTPNSVLFSHFHGDHAGGTDALMLMIGDAVLAYNNKEKSSDDRLKRRLTIASAHENVQAWFEHRMDESYPKVRQGFIDGGLDINFDVLKKGQKLEGMVVDFAATAHSVPNFAYRLTGKNGESLALSGDGALTPKSRELYRGVDLLVHEGFNVEDSTATHATIKDVIDFAVEAQISRVAIVHVNQAQRAKGYETGRIQELKNYAGENRVNVSFPDDGYTTAV